MAIVHTPVEIAPAMICFSISARGRSGGKQQTLWSKGQPKEPFERAKPARWNPNSSRSAMGRSIVEGKNVDEQKDDSSDAHLSSRLVRLESFV